MRHKLPAALCLLLVFEPYSFTSLATSSETDNVLKVMRPYSEILAERAHRRKRASQDTETIVDLVGSSDSLASPTETEPKVVFPEEKLDKKEDKRDVGLLTDPLNTYLQVGDWIAQWDAPYEAWYFYNSNTGVSTWEKPNALEDMDFSYPEADLDAVRQNIKIQQSLAIENEVDTGDNTVRGDRDTSQTFDLTRDTSTHGNQHGHGHHGCNRRDGSCGGNHGQQQQQQHHGHHGDHGDHGHHGDHGDHGCNRRDGSGCHGHQSHGQSQPLSFGNQVFPQQSSGAPSSSYFPSSTPSPSYAAPSPSYSAPAPSPTFAPASQDEYGSPIAPVQDEYGSPQAPVQDEYGAPQADVSTGYSPPATCTRRDGSCHAHPPAPSYPEPQKDLLLDLGLKANSFRNFVDGVFARFRQKVAPRLRVPDFIFPLKEALFAPFVGIPALLKGIKPPTHGYGGLRKKKAAKSKQQDILTAKKKNNPLAPAISLRPPIRRARRRG